MFNKTHILIILSIMAVLIIAFGVMLPAISYMLAAHNTIVNFCGVALAGFTAYIGFVISRHQIQKWK